VTKPRKAPVILSQEEVARLLQAAPSLKYKAAPSMAYGASLRVSEVANLKVSDIDSERMTLRVEQAKGHRDRDVMHTWGSALTHHPHVHVIVPGGGLSPDGSRWIACKPGFFRLRALALFGRRPPNEVAPFVSPASKNLHKTGCSSR
jgi:hypothetical protein